MTLEIAGLRKRYPGGVQALNDVSLTIGPGMFGLLGPNGAGKSTLRRTIATLQEADGGSVRLGGIDVLAEKDAVRRVLGYLPQEFGLYPKVSAEEMLDHFAALKGIASRSERRDVVHALLRKTNLFDVRKKPLGGYSGGMKQRFGIAQALLGNPRLIIVDEPTAGLDPEERVRFHNLLAEIGENVIVILSTHIVGDVADLCHAMAILHRGEVKRSGEPLALVAGLEGRIFETTVHDKALLPDLLGRHRVLSTRLVAGRTRLRVYAEQAPSGFTPATADLEDVYFATIRDFAS
jgi:ABC-type multidrug transport system ATPase subunit